MFDTVIYYYCNMNSLYTNKGEDIWQCSKHLFNTLSSAIRVMKEIIDNYDIKPQCLLDERTDIESCWGN